MNKHQTLQSALADDSLVIQYQTVGQYRSALLQAFPPRAAPVVLDMHAVTDSPESAARATGAIIDSPAATLQIIRGMQAELASLRVSAALVHPPAVRDVLAERQRQQDDEGWTLANDDEQRNGQLATAAGYYALACGFQYERDLGRGVVPTYWPWTPNWWKPKDKRSNLIRAGALIFAEIERIDRAVLHSQSQQAPHAD